jgi:hypothetical protein
MTDRELRKEFVRVEKTQNEVQILVHEIRWDGPHTPIHTWAVGKSLPATASKTEIENATAGILEDGGNFRTCNECGERKPLGWMLNGSLCQECAQANHGVVY